MSISPDSPIGLDGTGAPDFPQALCRLQISVPGAGKSTSEILIPLGLDELLLKCKFLLKGT